MDTITLSKEDLVKIVDEASSAAAAKAVEAKVKEFEAAAAAAAPSKFDTQSEKSVQEFARLDAKQKAADFIKAVFNKDMSQLSTMKAMTEGTGSAGGFVVPQEWAAEVFRVVEDFGLVPKLALKLPMNRQTLNVPRLSASVTVYWPGEGNVGTAAQPTLQQVVLTANTLVGLTPMTNELLADANVSVVDLLTTLFAEAIAGELDNQGFTGSGTPFTGILNDTGVTVYTPAAGNSTFTLCSTPDNARALLAQVKPWSLQGSAFIMHRSVWQLFQSTKASGSGEYFISAATPLLTGIAGQNFPLATAGMLWGYPVYLSEKMPSVSAISTKYVIFGNLSHLFLGMRDEIAVAISQDATIGATNLFAANMSAVRVTTRVAIAVGLPTAFAVLKTSAT